MTNLQLAELPLEELAVDPILDRGEDGERATEALQQSLQQYGQLDPLIVQADGEGRFQVIDGSRRVQAARTLAWETLWAIFGDGRQEDSKPSAAPSVAGFVVNQERKSLTPMDRARYAQAILERTGQSQQEVAEIVGVKPSTLSDMLKVVHDPQLVEAIRNEDLSFSAARVVASVSDQEEERSAFLDHLRAEKARA